MDYKAAIIKLLKKIDDPKKLKRIFDFIHFIFLHD